MIDPLTMTIVIVVLLKPVASCCRSLIAVVSAVCLFNNWVETLTRYDLQVRC